LPHLLPEGKCAYAVCEVVCVEGTDAKRLE